MEWNWWLLCLSLFLNPQVTVLQELDSCSNEGISLHILYDESNFRDQNHLLVVLRGLSYNSIHEVQWLRNGINIEALYYDDTHEEGGFTIRPTVHEEQPGIGCMAQVYHFDLLIRGKRPGTYTVVVVRGENELLESIILHDRLPPTNLILKQIADRKVEVRWVAPPTIPSEYIDYRVYVNSENINDEGIILLDTHYITNSLHYGDTITFRIRATSVHYWSDVLGPEAITIRCDVKNSSISFVNEDFRTQTTGRVTIRAIIPSPQARNFEWLRNDEVIHSGSRFHIYDVAETNSEVCFENSFKYDLLIKNNNPGSYQLRFQIHHENFHNLSIKLEGGDPLQDLVLTQMPGRRIKVSWTSMYQYVDYRVFINDHRVSTDGIIVPSTLYTTRPVQLNAFYFFRIRGTTKHYWSDVLGPKGILIFGVLKPSVHPISIKAESALLSIVQPNGGHLPTHYKIRLSRLNCSKRSVDNSENIEFTTSEAIILFNNLKKSCSYKLVITSINKKVNLTAEDVYYKFTTKSADLNLSRYATWTVDLILVCCVTGHMGIFAALCYLSSSISCCLKIKQRHLYPKAGSGKCTIDKESIYRNNLMKDGKGRDFGKKNLSRSLYNKERMSSSHYSQDRRTESDHSGSYEHSERESLRKDREGHKKRKYNDDDKNRGRKTFSGRYGSTGKYKYKKSKYYDDDKNRGRKTSSGRYGSTGKYKYKKEASYGRPNGEDYKKRSNYDKESKFSDRYRSSEKAKRGNEGRHRMADIQSDHHFGDISSDISSTYCDKRKERHRRIDRKYAYPRNIRTSSDSDVNENQLLIRRESSQDRKRYSHSDASRSCTDDSISEYERFRDYERKYDRDKRSDSEESI